MCDVIRQKEPVNYFLPEERQVSRGLKKILQLLCVSEAEEKPADAETNEYGIYYHQP
jgi:hypothetical protein